MHDAVQALRYVNVVAYVALGAVTLGFWRRRRDRASRWAAVAFGALGLLELLSLISNDSANFAERAIGRIELVLLVLFPYLLFRFTKVFRAPRTGGLRTG